MNRKPHSEATKLKISLAKKGTKPWNTGKKWDSKWKAKMSESRKRGMAEGRITHPWLGKKRSPEDVEKMRQAKLLNPTRYWLGKKMPMITGENHPNWNNGSSFEPYSREWTKILKEQIRERDKHTCVCGNPGKPVHHIDYDKKNCNPDNLITLCNSCHGKTNHNREYWKEFFKNLNRVKRNGR